MSTTLKMADGDLFIDVVTGRPKTIAGVEKCVQDVAEVLMTSLSQPGRAGRLFPRAYGSELATLDGPSRFGGLLGRPLVARKVQEAINRLIDLQESDPYLTAAEHIVAIRRLIVEQFGATDYAYFVQVDVADSSATQTVSNLGAIALNHQFPVGSETGRNQRARPLQS
jgi:hypothetical protein